MPCYSTLQRMRQLYKLYVRHLQNMQCLALEKKHYWIGFVLCLLEQCVKLGSEMGKS